MRIYFAAPLFSEAERRFNRALTSTLEAAGHAVFLPQRDGIESTRPPYNKMSPVERRNAMFELDRDEIYASDLFLFVLDGRVPDEGACVELGMAYTNKRLRGTHRYIFGLLTDVRAAFMGAKLNPMVRLCMDRVVESESELCSAIVDCRHLNGNNFHRIIA